MHFQVFENYWKCFLRKLKIQFQYSPSHLKNSWKLIFKCNFQCGFFPGSSEDFHRILKRFHFLLFGRSSKDHLKNFSKYFWINATISSEDFGEIFMRPRKKFRQIVNVIPDPKNSSNLNLEIRGIFLIIDYFREIPQVPHGIS